MRHVLRSYFTFERCLFRSQMNVIVTIKCFYRAWSLNIAHIDYDRMPTCTSSLKRTMTVFLPWYLIKVLAIIYGMCGIANINFVRNMIPWLNVLIALMLCQWSALIQIEQLHYVTVCVTEVD